MPYILKFYLIKIFSKPLILIITFILFILNQKTVAVDFCKDYIEELEDDYTLDFTESDLILLDIIKNLDFEIMNKNDRLYWRMFKLWWKMFNNVIGDQDYKDLAKRMHENR